MNLREKMRAMVAAWAKTATVEQMAELPEAIFFPNTGSVPAASASPAKQRNSRIRKRARGRVSQEDAKIIRTRLAGFSPGSAAYETQRNNLARELKYSCRQVSAAATGLERAAKRKKKKGMTKK